MKYYIKERQNPQTGTYYVPYGQISKKAAKDAGDAIYGTNVMHAYETEAEYKAAIKKLEDAGESLQ